jgi:hypothetical protein
VVTSGVPQGSHLSPLLFVLFINSIGKWLTKAKILLFADDIKVFTRVFSPADCLVLQSELNIFGEWVKHLGLTLNVDKCSVMSFTRSRSPLLYDYLLNDTLLQRTTFIKDLGIHFTPSLNFDHHINVTVGKALKVLGFIKRNTKSFTSASCLRTLYFSLVRSILEYGGVIWHPYLAKDQLRLERVQNKFLSYASYILKINHPPHDYSLIRNTLKIPSLSTRRLDADSNFIFSLLNGFIDAPDLLSSISFRVPSHSARNHQLFAVPTHKTAYGHNHPIHRMLRQVNLLDHY